MAITVTALSPALGAEIRGADIATGIAAGDMAAIVDAWHEYALVLLRGQDITEDQQVEFGRHFGPLAPWSRFADSVSTDDPDHNRYIMLVSNLRENGAFIGNLPEGEIEFHSDGIYVEEPLAATMLYAVRPTEHGGETAFANMYAAYDALDADMKARIEGLKALHAFTYNTTRTEENTEKKRDWSHVAHFVHPVVRTHPVTGRRAIYVNRLMTQEIVGLDENESAEILEALYAHMERPEFIYEHPWQKGDVLIWDNRCLAHARRDFPPHETRIMKRLTIAGERPA